MSDLLTELDSTNGSTAFNISKPVVKPKPMASFNLSAEKRAAKDYIKRFSLPKLKPTPLPIKSPEKNSDDNEYLGKEPSKTLFKNFQNKIENNKLANESNIRVEASKENEIIAADEVMEVENVEIVAKDQSNKECVFDDDLDMSGIMDILPNDMTDNKPIENITEEQLLSGWETMQETSINDKLMFDLDTLQLPMVSNEDGSKVENTIFLIQLNFDSMDSFILFKSLIWPEVSIREHRSRKVHISQKINLFSTKM